MATSSVTNVANLVKNAKADWSSKMQLMNAAKETIGEADLEALQGLLTQGEGLDVSMGEVGTQIQSFIGDWTEKSKGLTALTDGLAAGKIEGNVPEQIASLKEALAGATSNVTGWTDKLNELRTTGETIATEFQALSSNDDGE